MDFADLNAALSIVNPFRLYQVADSLCGLEIEGIYPIVPRSVNNCLRSNLVVDASQFCNYECSQAPGQKEILKVISLCIWDIGQIDQSLKTLLERRLYMTDMQDCHIWKA